MSTNRATATTRTTTIDDDEENKNNNSEGDDDDDDNNDDVLFEVDAINLEITRCELALLRHERYGKRRDDERRRPKQQRWMNSNATVYRKPNERGEREVLLDEKKCAFSDVHPVNNNNRRRQRPRVLGNEMTHQNQQTLAGGDTEKSGGRETIDVYVSSGNDRESIYGGRCGTEKGTAGAVAPIEIGYRARERSGEERAEKASV